MRIGLRVVLALAVVSGLAVFALSIGTKGPTTDQILTDVSKKRDFLTDRFDFEIENKEVIKEQKTAPGGLIDVTCLTIRIEMSAKAKEELKAIENVETFRARKYPVSGGPLLAQNEERREHARTQASIDTELAKAKEAIEKLTVNGRCVEPGPFFGCMKYEKLPLAPDAKAKKLQEAEAHISGRYTKVIKKGEVIPFVVIAEFCKDNQTKPEKWEINTVTSEKKEEKKK